MVKKNEQIPSDLILIGSSNDDGIAYIATAELDGETNLKRRATVKEFGDVHSNEQVSAIQGKVDCDQPNERLYQFQGRISLEDGKQYSLNADQLLLRVRSG